MCDQGHCSRTVLVIKAIKKTCLSTIFKFFSLYILATKSIRITS